MARSRSDKLKGTVKPDKPRQVLISGEAMLYASKAPYVPSGVSISGALEYDPDDDTIRCHECGKWFKSLGTHLVLHGMKAREYKMKHGLYESTALINESLRETFIEVGKRISAMPSVQAAFQKNWEGHFGKRKPSKFFKGKGRPEGKNTNVLCIPQLTEKIQKLSEQLGGKTPTSHDLERAGINVKTVSVTFGGLSKAMEICGLMPNRRFGDGGLPVYEFSREALIAILKNFHKMHGRYPTSSDADRRLIPGICVFDRVCGSWRSALEAAGATGADLFRFNKNLSDAEVFRRLKIFYKREGRIPTLSVVDKPLLEAYGIPPESFFRHRYGSMRAALKRAHLPVYSGSRRYTAPVGRRKAEAVSV